MKAFIKNWLIPLLALGALAALIWFVGPLIAIGGWVPFESETVRWIAIGVVALLWLIWRIVRLISAKKHEREMLAGLVEAPPDPAAVESAEEIAALRRRLDEAVGVLKKARLGASGGERQTLYQLPWYILIGPPGSGKTTALIHSGLNFPLAEHFGKDAIRGVGGTRNCDWWFTDEAVLLDTAGRYTTQDSHAAVDKAAWLGFLDLLKQHRRRRPISGALIAISVAELMQSSEAERNAHARAIRARIQELHERLGIRFPIYVLLTKSDLIAGFTEFFDDLGKDERGQVWGMTFPLDETGNGEPPLARFAAEFAALEQRLSARQTERLQGERDPGRRALIYAFPKQFEALRDLLDGFLNEAFRPNAYEQRPLLRGVYFTSGTQEGTPIDRLMAGMAQTFRLARTQLGSLGNSGRSYFLTRLFRETVFPEQGLAGVNLKLERRRAWLQAGAWAAALLITLGMGALWLLSWQGNRALITDTDAQVTDVRKLLEKVSPDQREALAVLPLLDAVRTLPGGYAERDEGTPWRLGFGLYQGDMLGSEATAVYRRMLHGALLPRLILRLEQQIRANQANPDILFVALKTYLMLENPDHYEPDAIKAWIALDWDNNLPRDVTREQRQHLREHLDALFEKRPLPLPLALDRQLIGQTQAILVRVPLPVRAYDRMKRFVAQDNKAYPDFRIDTAAGRDAGLVLRRASGKPLGEGVPGFYTYRGYTEGFGKAGTELVARLAEESWVLGDVGRIAPQDLPQLIEDVRRLYFADYIKVWDALIADVGVVPLGNTQQAIDILRVLSGPGSPLKLWLEAVARETNLARKEGLAAAGDKAADSAVDKLKQQLASLIGSTGATPPPAVAAAQELDPVTRHFADLAAQVRKDGSNPAPIDATLAAFNDLYVKLNTQAGASGDALIKDAAGQTAAVVRGLKLDADRAPPAVGAVMKAVADQADGLTMGGVRNQINQLWQAEVADFYRQTLAGRYPLARSPRDAALADFGEFFAPDGRIDKFFKNYLARYVDQSTKPWRWQPNATDKLGISAGVLVQFQNAATIRDAYFRAGTAGPGVRFDLEPVSMDAEIAQIIVDLDGQLLTYAHGPTRATAMQWPTPNGAGNLQISITPPGNSGRTGLSYDGPWALFRMLDQQSVRGSGEVYTVTINVDGRSASFRLRANSAFNPFRLPALGAFSCPDRL